LTGTILGANVIYILLSLPYSLHALIATIDKGYLPNGVEADPRRYYLFMFVEVNEKILCLLMFIEVNRNI
jgi:hypothetical protein